MKTSDELREETLHPKDHSMEGTVNIKKLGVVRKADQDLFQELRIREEIEINHQHGEFEGTRYYE